MSKKVLRVLEESLSCFERSELVSIPLEVGASTGVLPLRVNVLLYLIKACQSLAPEELELLNDLPQKSFLDQIIDDLLVLLLGVKSSKYLHGVNNVSLLLASLSFEFLLSFEVEEATLYDEFLASDSLVEAGVVELDD